MINFDFYKTGDGTKGICTPVSHWNYVNMFFDRFWDAEHESRRQIKLTDSFSASQN